MSTFIGDARPQVEDILEYASALGDVALVDLSNGTIELSAGVEVDEQFVLAARSRGWPARPVVMLDDWMVVGAVGTAHVLVLRMREPLLAHAVAVARVTKTCLLLTQMLPPTIPGAPRGPDGESGASGAAAAFAPRGRRVRPFGDA